MRRAVFLDRDGVLNSAIVRDGKAHSPSGPDDLDIVPGAVDACAALRKAGFVLVVVTNQPEVARGTLKLDVVEAMNQTLRSRIPVEDILVCCHDDRDGCTCRKPQPGLILQAARKWQIDLRSSFLVGDRWKDIEAGLRARCTTVLIDYGYAEAQQSTPDYRASSLQEAVDWIIRRTNSLAQG